jgi:hypothetical protein
MKIESFLSPVNMTYELSVKGLDHEGILKLAAAAQEIAAEKGIRLDLGRLPVPTAPFRRLDLSGARVRPRLCPQAGNDPCVWPRCDCTGDIR